MSETWLLNDCYDLTESNEDFTSINFTSYSQSFVRIVRQYDNRPFPPVNSLLYYKSDGTYVSAVYTVDDLVYWSRPEYRTLTFATPPTGDLLTWLQANGTKQSNKLSVDLTTLSGWSNLAPGNHTIKIVAKATGYRDSEKSAGVEVTKAAEVYTDCLTFTGETSEFTLKASSKEWDGTLQWSTDHNTWTNLTATEEMQSVGKKLYLRGKGNTTFGSGSGSGIRWQLSARAGCSGNIQTLLDWENPPTSISKTYCYSDMFYGCTNLTTAPVLPATTLADKCYSGMFYGCSSLTQAPELPATTLAVLCYWNMFRDCTSLTTAPELPATTLVTYCYYNMFYGCTKLKINASSGNKIFTCPSSIPSQAVSDMFSGTGGTFKGTPTAGNTYYWTE